MDNSNSNKKKIYLNIEPLYNFSKLTYPILWISSKFNFLPTHEMILKSHRRWSPA